MSGIDWKKNYELVAEMNRNLSELNTALSRENADLKALLTSQIRYILELEKESSTKT